MKNMLMPSVSLSALAAARPDSVVGHVLNEGDTPDFEKLFNDMSKELDRIGGEVKQTAEDALKQAKQSGDVSSETKDAADKLLRAQTDTSKVVDELKAKLEGLDTKTLEIQQAVAEGRGGSGSPGVLSLGQAVVAEEEQIKAFLDNGATGTLNLKVQNAITTAGGSGGGLIYVEEERDPVQIPKRQLRIRDLLAKARTSSDSVKYREQVLRTNNAAAVAEEGAAPASEYGWDKASAEVKKIAHTTNISEEAMADADQLQSEVDVEMRYGLDLEEEAQIVAGDGIGENLSGLMTGAPAFAAAAGLPNATRIDRLRLAFLQIALEDYIASSVTLHPTDWAGIEMLKDANNNYIFGNPHGQTTPIIWGKDVVQTKAFSVGEWLAGDLRMAATIYDRADTEILISSEHGTNFVDGMLTMKGTKRLALAIKRALAMVQGDFTFA